jgi:hypothetical protein
MPEIEIHAEGGAHADPTAKRVGLLVGTVGIALTVVTIAAHREHTAAVILRTEANDAWAYYQAKKIRAHVSDVGADLVRALAGDGSRAAVALGKLESGHQRYDSEAEKIMKDAEEKEAATTRAEQRAFRFDLGEGFLELGLVVSSLYFLGRQRAFPAAGALAALVGALIAGSALF